MGVDTETIELRVLEIKTDRATGEIVQKNWKRSAAYVPEESGRCEGSGVGTSSEFQISR